MAIYYLWDEQARIDKNRGGENYWFTYITEILSHLGVKGAALMPEEMGKTVFGPGDVLFLGSDDVSAHETALYNGAKNGLTVIGFAAAGADALFGVNCKNVIGQPDDVFTVNGYFTFRDNCKNDYLAVPGPAPSLPVFAPVIDAEASSADILADISLGGKSYPAFVKHNNAYYFAFDLAQTLWASAQGRPVYDGTERFPRCSRIADARITPMDYDTSVAYGDYYLYIIQTILYGLDIPMIHRLPPADGGVPDFILFHAGDEDAALKLTARASEIMYGRGWPYQINLMPDGENMDFATTREECEAIWSRGHRVSMHYNMVSAYPWCEWTPENFKKQYKAYLRHVGDTCLSSVGHCLTHIGWAERCRYQEALGILGDNARCGEYDPEDLNAFNLYGFAFGTSFPYYLYDDSFHGNRRIDMTDIPIAFYEPRIGGKYSTNTDKIKKCVDEAAYFGRMVELFTHPHYVADNGAYDNRITLAAFDVFDAYIAENNFKVKHYIPDNICLFWRGREKSAVTNASRQNGVSVYRVECLADDGLVVKFPAKKAKKIEVDGADAEPVYKTVDGLEWLMVPVFGKNGHIIKIYG